MNGLTHPGMTPAFFDKAVGRAMLCELTIQQTTRPGTVAIGSSTDDELVYLVTDTTCTCKAGQTIGRCFHRALWLAYSQVWSTVELGAARFADDDTAA